MAALQVGILGGFQTGKSTLINCLLEDRVAISGGGIATTKQVIKYFYSGTPCLHVRKGDRMQQVKVHDYAKVSLDQSIVYCEIGIPCDFLKKIELWDTPGFDANDRDDQVTIDCLKNLDCAIFLLGGSTGGFCDAGKAILKKITDRHLPHVVVFNSQNTVDDQWIPHSERNRWLRQTTAAQMKQLGINSSIEISQDTILAINTAWFWHSFAENNRHKRMLLENAPDGENELRRKVSNFLAFSEEINATKIEDYSNIPKLKDFLTEGSICFGNIHTIVGFYQGLNDIRAAFKNNLHG